MVITPVGGDAPGRKPEVRRLAVRDPRLKANYVPCSLPKLFKSFLDSHIFLDSLERNLDKYRVK